MTEQRYTEVSTLLIETAKEIENAKRPGYTRGEADVLTNFKDVAQRVGVTPMQAWAVYFLKHVDAITSVAKNPDIPQAEAIEGRFADAVNYLKLGWALLNDTENRP